MSKTESYFQMIVYISLSMSHKVACISVDTLPSAKEFLMFDNVCFLLVIWLNSPFRLIDLVVVSVLSWNICMVNDVSCNCFPTRTSVCYNNVMWFIRRRFSNIARLIFVLLSVHLANSHWLVEDTLLLSSTFTSCV